MCGNCIRSRSQLDLVSTDRHNFVTCIQAAQYLTSEPLSAPNVTGTFFIGFFMHANKD